MKCEWHSLQIKICMLLAVIYLCAFIMTSKCFLVLLLCVNSAFNAIDMLLVGYVDKGKILVQGN